MREPNWWSKAVIYELYVDKFAGNFQGLIDHLDYLVYLGVDTLWLLPHYPSPQVDTGYDISDYCAIREDLGTMADFDAFLVAAHSRGLKVILDLVLNHTSDQHAWFKESRSSKDSPKRDWYLWSDNTDKFSQAYVHFADVKTTGNWIKNAATGDYYYASFYPQQPDLNWDNPEVVGEMYKVIDFWLQKGVDGFRLDAISRLIKRDGTFCFALPETHQALKNLRTHIDQNFSNIVLLAEAGGWPHEAHQFFGNSDECHLVLDFPLSVQILNAVPDKSLAEINDLWARTPPAPANCNWAGFLTSHDSVDVFFLTSEDAKADFVRRVDPYDQYSFPGGGSLAARVAQVCNGDLSDAAWAIHTQFDQPAVPILYYGNEIGMLNASLKSPPADKRDYVRGAFDWDEANRQVAAPQSLLNTVRALIIRHRNNVGR